MKKSIPYTSNQEMIDEALKMDINNVVLHHAGYVISIADHKHASPNVLNTREIAIWKKDSKPHDIEVITNFGDELASFIAALDLATDRIHELVGGGG